MIVFVSLGIVSKAVAMFADVSCIATRATLLFTALAGFNANHILASGDRWVVAPEIFWKARGDHDLFTETAVACVFKKIYGATARR
jgi:hypothetical protein